MNTFLAGFKFDSEYHVPIDAGIYSVKAILRSAYWLTDSCYVLVTRPEVGQYVVHLSAKSENSSDLESLAGDFMNSLIDNQIRVELAEEAKNVRDLIVAKAFAEGDLLEDPIPGTADDPVRAGAHWNELQQEDVHEVATRRSGLEP